VQEEQTEVDIPIPETFRPDAKVAETSMDGRVIYENVNYSFLSADTMRSVGEEIAKAFPSFTVWVTGGPYRGYDVRHQIDPKRKIISIDFYSPRPGLQYIRGIIKEMKYFLKKKGVSP